MAIENIFNTKVGLALGSGGAKGIAHIGVLKALQDAHVQVDYVAGTSVGAMVASVQTATGRKPDFIAGKPSKLAFELISGLNSKVKPENTGNIEIIFN